MAIIRGSRKILIIRRLSRACLLFVYTMFPYNCQDNLWQTLKMLQERKYELGVFIINALVIVNPMHYLYKEIAEDGTKLHCVKSVSYLLHLI